MYCITNCHTYLQYRDALLSTYLFIWHINNTQHFLVFGLGILKLFRKSKMCLNLRTLETLTFDILLRQPLWCPLSVFLPLSLNPHDVTFPLYFRIVSGCHNYLSTLDTLTFKNSLPLYAHTRSSLSTFRCFEAYCDNRGMVGRTRTYSPPLIKWAYCWTLIEYFCCVPS